MREKVAILVSHIEAAMPGMTVHDVTHLDALWDTASLVCEGAIEVNPAEAFVFGASLLLHDSAMSLAAYPRGLTDLQQTVAWKDTVTAIWSESSNAPCDLANVPQSIVDRAVPVVLRQLHAQHAAVLAKQAWTLSNGEQLYLIDDPEPRFFYGEHVGLIAHSHWWPVSRIERELSEDLGAFPGKTRSRIDRVKLACLLRIADAIHLDQRRAPRFRRVLAEPGGESALHWTFQERLAAPHIEHEAVVFTSGEPFSVSDAESWWLAFDTIVAVDRELQDVDALMQNRGRKLVFKARRVKGAGNPESLARLIQPSGWRPIDTKLRVSDIPKVVAVLGGTHLYGDDPVVAVRELIQNGLDAIEARRRIQGRPRDWGVIRIEISERPDGHWLIVEDNGIGMSERVMTGPLLDFGASFWKSSLAAQEFPGLIAKGMNSIGRYGIGFFSVFMLGSTIRVISRRFDQGEDAGRVLEFRGGTGSRPIVSPAPHGTMPLDGGTRVEVLLKCAPTADGGLFDPKRVGSDSLTIKQVVCAIAPSVGAAIHVVEGGLAADVIRQDDWLTLNGESFLSRVGTELVAGSRFGRDGWCAPAALREIVSDEGRVIARACIAPSRSFMKTSRGWVTVGGLRASRMNNVVGVFVGEALTASRSVALPAVRKTELARWATEQASIIAELRVVESVKASVAEVVLECGGDISDLPIVRRGDRQWLSSSELREYLADKREISVALDGEFSYEEDADPVHPREFAETFEIADDVLIVPSHDGSILAVGERSWPQMITGVVPQRGSNLGREVLRIVAQEWGDDWDSESDEREIGTVGSTPITREIHRLVRSASG